MEKESSSQERLKTYEWIVVFFIIGMMGSLLMFSIVNKNWVTASVKEHHFMTNEIEVYVSGSIENPGTIIVKRGSTYRDLQPFLKPTSAADLTKLQKTTKLKQGQVITIPEKKNYKTENKSRKKKVADF